MLPRLFLVTVLLVVSVVGQEEDQAGADVSSSEPLSVAERPRGERAEEGDNPPPRRQRQRCQLYKT